MSDVPNQGPGSVDHWQILPMRDVSVSGRIFGTNKLFLLDLQRNPVMEFFLCIKYSIIDYKENALHAAF